MARLRLEAHHEGVGLSTQRGRLLQGHQDGLSAQAHERHEDDCGAAQLGRQRCDSAGHDWLHSGHRLQSEDLQG